MVTSVIINQKWTKNNNIEKDNPSVIITRTLKRFPPKLSKIKFSPNFEI